MSGRTTLIAAVVLLALGGYIYKYEREPVKSESDADTKREKVFTFEEAKVKSIEVKKAEGVALRVTRGTSGWQIVAPTEAAADSTEVDALARNLATLERERIVAEGGANLADFGLAPPAIEIGFDVEGQKERGALLLGAKSPTGSSQYAKLAGEDKVFVVPSYLESSFDKKVWDLRDKSIFRFNREDVEKVVVRSPGGELALARASEDLWNVTTPSICRADRYKASGLVSRFETGRMEEIVSESGEDLKGYGLDKPQYQLELQLKGGRARKLFVGKEKDSRFYARNPARPFVYLIASTLVDDLKKDFSEYRSKRLFDFSTYQVTKFQLGARVLEKTRVDDKDQWKETAPESKEVDRTAVEDLLYKLNGTDAESFAADRVDNPKTYGMDAPAVTISVWSNEGKNVEELKVGKVGDSVYARRKGDDPVLKIASSAWQEIEKLMALAPKKDASSEKKEDPKK